MIDERLKSGNTFEVHQNRLAKQAEDYIKGISDKECLEKAIAEWWRKYAGGEFGSLAISLPDITPDGVYQEPLFIQTMKKSSDFFKDYVLSIRPELREAIIDLIRDPGRADGIEKDAAGRLFGRVIATELAKNEPDLDQMNLAFSCFEVVIQFWSSFKETFEKTLSDCDKTKDRWIASLSMVSSTTDIFAYFIRMSDPADRSEIEFEQTEWKNTDNPFCVWDSRHFFYPDKFISFVPLEILYQLDLKVWIESLENLPLPRLKEIAIMDSDLEQDPQAILKLIRESSPVFDEYGKWSDQRKTAALYGVMAAFGFAEELFKIVNENDPDTLKYLKEQELPEWFRNAFEAVLQRPDGKIISAGFLAWLIRQHVGELIRERERGREGEWSPTGCAIDILAEKLAEKCNTWEMMQDAWKFQQKSSGDGEEDNSEINRLLEQGLPVLQSNSMQYYLGEVLIDESLSIRGNVTDNVSGKKLWDWFAELLRKRDPFIDYVCNPHLQGSLNWISYNIGRILAHIQEPVKGFSEAWNLLQYQRNRVFHQMSSNDFTACYPSQLLIRVGIGAILWASDNPDKKSMGSDSAKELWSVLFDSAYHIWSMKRIDMNSSSFRVLNQCIGVLPLLFKEDIENPVRRIINYFKTDSKMLCNIAWLLCKNGLDIERVDSLLRELGVSIMDSLEEEVELTELSGSEKEMMPLYKELTIETKVLRHIKQEGVQV